jgi:hypothetical protein
MYKNFMMVCCIPVSGDWYCNKKGSSKIPCLATQGENGLGGIGCLRGDITAWKAMVSESSIICTNFPNTGEVVPVFPDVIYLKILNGFQ